MALPFQFPPTFTLTTSNLHKNSFFSNLELQEVPLARKGNLPGTSIKRNLPTALAKEMR
jgi:hypothetical protein